MSIWRANVGSEANAENLLRRIEGKRESAELVEKIEKMLGKRGKSIFVFLYIQCHSCFKHTIFNIACPIIFQKSKKFSELVVQTVLGDQTMNVAAHVTRIIC